MMLCETHGNLERLGAEIGWSGGTLLLLVCRWAEERGFAQDLTDHLAGLADEEFAGDESAEQGPPDADGFEQTLAGVVAEEPAATSDDGSGAPIRLRQFADLSTAHLTEDLSNWLDAECARRADGRATEGMPSV